MPDPVFNLIQKQQAFARLIASLITFAYAQGYKITLGEAYRTPEQAKWNAAHGLGIANSLHISRLAMDFIVWKDGKMLTSFEDHKPLGEHWESLSTPGLQCCWGGRFHSIVDSGHFSISHNGYK